MIKLRWIAYIKNHFIDFSLENCNLMLIKVIRELDIDITNGVFITIYELIKRDLDLEIRFN
jgi:hypothetical protein